LVILAPRLPEADKVTNQEDRNELPIRGDLGKKDTKREK